MRLGMLRRSRRINDVTSNDAIRKRVDKTASAMMRRVSFLFFCVFAKFCEFNGARLGMICCIDS